MARDLFIDLTNNRLAASESNSAPAGDISFVKGDNGTFNLYFLEATGTINNPFVIVDKSAASVKFGIGSRTGVPDSGTYTLTFGGDTTSSIAAAATAGAVQTALNALSAISSAGGVTVTGELSEHFTVRFNNNGSRALISADVSQLIPDTVAVIDERLAGSGSVKEIQEIQLRLNPAVYQATWANLGTTVTATVATTTTGSSTANEVQRLTFSQEPYSGTFRLSFPSTTVTSSATVTAGVFITTANHGLALNQPITITGFDTTITGYTRGTQYFVKAVPAETQFTLSATIGGTALTGSATAATTSGTITTILRQTSQLAAGATAADIQSALEALDSIGAGGVIVGGLQGQYYDITFNGQKGYAVQPDFTVQSGLTAKQGKTAEVDFATFALRDLLNNDTNVDLSLEIELTESSKRSTVILQDCSVSEELIDADSFSPTVGYPSYIFQALTAAATNATTSLVAITGLDWTAQANSEYLAEWNLFCEDLAGGDFKGMVTVPTGTTFYGRWMFVDILNDTIYPIDQPLTTDTHFMSADGDIRQSTQKAYITTGSTAGTVSFKFAKNVAGITATAQEISTGSWVRVEKVK